MPCRHRRNDCQLQPKHWGYKTQSAGEISTLKGDMHADLEFQWHGWGGCADYSFGQE